MAILQFYQAKALKQMHEGSTDLSLMQELRMATNFTPCPKSIGAVLQEDNVHLGGLSALSLAQSGQDERCHQSSLS